MKHKSLYSWINDNNPDDKYSFSKGWWDGAEFILQIAQSEKLNRKIKNIEVVHSYINKFEYGGVEEEFKMPVYKISFQDASIYLQMHLPGMHLSEWLISVKSNLEIESEIKLFLGDFDSVKDYHEKGKLEFFKVFNELGLVYNEASDSAQYNISGVAADNYELYSLIQAFVLMRK